MMKPVLIVGVLALGAIGAIVGAPAAELLGAASGLASYAASGDATSYADLPDDTTAALRGLPAAGPGIDETTAGLPCHETDSVKACVLTEDTYGYDIHYTFDCGAGSGEETIYYHRTGEWPALVWHDSSGTRAGWLDNRVSSGRELHVFCDYGGGVVVTADVTDDVTYTHDMEAGGRTGLGDGGTRYLRVNQFSKEATSTSSYTYSEPGYSERGSSAGTANENGTGVAIIDGCLVNLLGLANIGCVGALAAQNEAQYQSEYEYESPYGSSSGSSETDRKRTAFLFQSNPASVTVEQKHYAYDSVSTGDAYSSSEDYTIVTVTGSQTAVTPSYTFIQAGQIERNGGGCNQFYAVNGPATSLGPCTVEAPEVPTIPQLPTFPAPPVLPAPPV